MDEVNNGIQKMENGLPTSTVTLDKKVSFLDVIKHRRDRSAVVAIVSALTLGIMGGAVLPVAWAFSITGIICGVLIMVVVASANAYTCDLLLKQAYATATYDYESLCFMIGGRWWKLVTEISIVILLLGSLVGGTAQVGEVGTIGLTSINSHLPDWLAGSSGRFLMTLGTLVIVVPLCMGKQLRQLEYAGMVGIAIVLWLTLTVVIKSSRENLPAIRNKEFALVGFTNLGDITQAVTIFGFAFYAQPIMMPFLLEVPEGLVGVKIVSYGMRIVVLINAFVIYFLTGFFGAALYGKATEGNILENEWLGGGVAQGMLNLSMAVYLCLAVPAMEFPTRHTINGWLPEGFLKHHPYVRQLLITAAILTFSLGVALLFPSSSANVLVVTGATGVCMASYLIPIVNHFLLYFNSSKIQKEAVEELKRITEFEEVNKGKNDELTFTTSIDYTRARLSTYVMPRRPGIWPMVKNSLKYVVIPTVVLAVGLFCSVAALTTL
ncbi:hypothetical protein R1sor_015555 [Riccia sorocarpa]|uniref:Amino acid transporter transmembrane domain-containing protein n=1 Tax=Riccia sorocarpa TaxID=122646 RepID=A0ABD3HGR0_9MARC